MNHRFFPGLFWARPANPDRVDLLTEEVAEPVRMQCGHDVFPPETWGHHAPLYWDKEGLDTCYDCKIQHNVWMAVMDSFGRYERRVWDEAAWYVAERDHVIAEQNASIEFLENELQGEL